MTSRYLTLKDKDLWLQFWKKLSEENREPFFHPGYYEAFERRGGGAAGCFLFEQGERFALYPFLKNGVGQKGYFDIEGAHGYNGIGLSNNEETFPPVFQEAFLDFCRDQKIVAEFTRFNPVHDAHPCSQYMKRIHTIDNVIVDLTLSEETLWNHSYTYAVRKSVNKAKRHNLSAEIVAGTSINKQFLDTFLNIFHETLQRNQAPHSAYFDRGFFETLIKTMPQQILFFFTMMGNRAVSAELVLLSPETGYSYLGGTEENFFDFRPNHLLKDAIIRSLKQMGKKRYCIGGGQSVDDRLFRYKNSYAVNGVYPFFIGTKIHNEKIYESLCREWEKKYQTLAETKGNFFLRYKLTE